MGSKFSKREEQINHSPPRQGSSSHHSSNHSNDSGKAEEVTPEADLSSYEAACQADPQLRSLDATLQERTSRAINSIALNLDVRSLSLDSLREVTECLLEMNQEVVNVILQCKKDIWKDGQLYDLVNDYFENSLQSLDFCTALEACLKRALHSQSIIQLALQKFDEERANAEESGNPYPKTLQELRNFKDAGDPFTREFFSLFQGVYKQQLLMLEKLQAKKTKLDKKLRTMKGWRRVSNVIFVAAFVSVLICSVVAAAVTAPPVVTALAAAAAVPLGSMGKWLNSIWSKCEKDLKGQREVIFSMQLGNYVVIQDLDGIRVLADKLRIEIEALLQTAAFAMREDEAVVIAVSEIKKRVDGFMRTIQELNDHADKCSRDIRRARAVILRRIINYPSSSNQGNGRFKEVMEIFNNMQEAGVQPDKASCNILIGKCCRAREIEAMRKILQYMRENALVLRIAVYCQALETLKAAGENDILLLEVNHHLSKESFEKVETDKFITSNADDISAVDRALVLHLLSKQDCVAIDCLLADLTDKSIELDSGVISMIIEVNSSYCRQVGAIIALEYIVKLGINVERTAYLALLGVFVRTNSLANVVDIVHKMIKEGVSLGTHLSALILYRLGCAKQLVSAVEVFSLLPDEQKSTATYTALIAAFFSSGNTDKGLETFETMRRQGINVALGTYRVLLSGLEQSGQVQKLDTYRKEKRILQARSSSQDVSTEEMICNLLFADDYVV